MKEVPKKEEGTDKFINLLEPLREKGKDKGKGHPCTGTEALYRPYGP